MKFKAKHNEKTNKSVCDRERHKGTEVLVWRCQLLDKPIQAIFLSLHTMLMQRYTAECY